jgi:hypothetical protein
MKKLFYKWSILKIPHESTPLIWKSIIIRLPMWLPQSNSNPHFWSVKSEAIGNWDALKTFYVDKGLEVSNANLAPVWTIPLQIEHNDQRSWLDFSDEFSDDPSQSDILQALQDHYSSDRSMQRLGEVEGNIYFVYMFAEH